MVLSIIEVEAIIQQTVKQNVQTSSSLLHHLHFFNLAYITCILFYYFYLYNNMCYLYLKLIPNQQNFGLKITLLLTNYESLPLG